MTYIFIMDFRLDLLLKLSCNMCIENLKMKIVYIKKNGKRNHKIIKIIPDKRY